MLNNLHEAVFRANPKFRLTELSRLSDSERQILREYETDPKCYGVLAPVSPEASSVKTIDRDTALLLFALLTPGKLPAYLSAMLGEAFDETIARLVLDGVIEIESEGRFVSGAESYRALYDESATTADSEARTGVLARLSLEALRYAQELQIYDPEVLSARLYFYNRIPAAPAWKRRFPDSKAIARYLGFDAGGENALMGSHWELVNPAPEYQGWTQWRPKAGPRTASSSSLYKLYVSPSPEVLREAFSATIEAARACLATGVKTARDVYGLLRPDKLIAYFDDLDRLKHAADMIRSSLAGCRAHGVPFSAPLSEDGLLSWGVDPPRYLHLRARWGESWRLWVTNRLALSLLEARRESASHDLEPWQFALRRLQLEGINTDDWTPVEVDWEKP